MFPVTIDPTVKIEKATTTIDDCFIQSKNANTPYGSDFMELNVGWSHVYENSRILIKFNQLPALEKGAVITDARINLYQYDYSTYGLQSYLVSAHKVTSSWGQRTVTWNSQPSWESSALDYLTIDNQTGCYYPRTLDVTKLVKEWYNNPNANYGILLKAVDENNDAMINRAHYAVSNYTIENNVVKIEDFYNKILSS